MLKRRSIILISLALIILLTASCAMKIDRTFGPITLKVGNIHLHQNNVYTLKGMLGFEPYTFEITYDGSGTCWIDEFGRIHVGSVASDYWLYIKVKDSKGNEGVTEYYVDTFYLEGNWTYNYSSYSYQWYYAYNYATDRYGNCNLSWSVIPGATTMGYWYYSYPISWYNNRFYDYNIGGTATIMVTDNIAGSTVTATITFIP